MRRYHFPEAIIKASFVRRLPRLHLSLQTENAPMSEEETSERLLHIGDQPEEEVSRSSQTPGETLLAN